MTYLAKIHAMRREVGLMDDEDWRDLLERCTGSRSARGLTLVQSDAVVAELGRLGAKGRAKRAGRAQLSGPYRTKLQALWVSCWNLGLVADRSDAALNAFARRQTGLGHVNWVREPKHAVAVIEALKAMLERAGVDWGPLHPLPGTEWIELPQARVAMAQFRALAGEPSLAGRSFQQWVRGFTSQPPARLEGGDWIVVTGHLGKLIRDTARARR